MGLEKNGHFYFSLPSAQHCTGQIAGAVAVLSAGSTDSSEAKVAPKVKRMNS